MGQISPLRYPDLRTGPRCDSPREYSLAKRRWYDQCHAVRRQSCSKPIFICPFLGIGPQRGTAYSPAEWTTEIDPQGYVHLIRTTVALSESMRYASIKTTYGREHKQVTLLGDIHKTATGVRLWLGHEAASNDALLRHFLERSARDRGFVRLSSRLLPSRLPPSKDDWDVMAVVKLFPPPPL